MIRGCSLILFLLCVLVVTPGVAAVPESIDVSSVLHTRQVAGVVYFKANSLSLTKRQKAEIDRIVSSALEKRADNGIIRVEGFATNRDLRSGVLHASLTRARSVWNYLNAKHNIDKDLYLTGFGGKQNISSLRGGRVEIAIYDNLFLVTDGGTSSH